VTTATTQTRPGVSNAARGPGAPEPGEDSAQGLAMFVIFTGAVLFVTGTVALLALVGSWWMLGVAFAMHAAMTAVVTLMLLHVMTEPKRAIPVSDRPSARPTPGAGHRTDLMASPGLLAPPPARRGAIRPGAQRDPGRHRVLVVTDENLAEANEVPEPIRPLVDHAEDIYVVAPTLTTRLQSLTDDSDHARMAAGKRLLTVFEHMHARGLLARGRVGDEDQVTAIADALADFDADLLLLRLHARGSKDENWREHRLARRVRSHFNLPMITFFFDDQGYVVGRELG
jgi:hypothetical protein